MNIFRKHCIRSIYIWILTGILGSIYPWASGTIGLAFHEVVVLSLVFSLPTILILVPSLYIIQRISGYWLKVIYAATSVLVVSLSIIGVVLFVLNGYWYARDILIPLLLPYIIAAEFSFFLVAKNVIWNRVSFNFGFAHLWTSRKFLLKALLNSKSKMF